jgi:hypothetical protein
MLFTSGFQNPQKQKLHRDNFLHLMIIFSKLSLHLATISSDVKYLKVIFYLINGRVKEKHKKTKRLTNQYLLHANPSLTHYRFHSHSIFPLDHLVTHYRFLELAISLSQSFSLDCSLRSLSLNRISRSHSHSIVHCSKL